MAKRVFIDEDRKYTIHVKKLRDKIKKLQKQNWEFFVLGGLTVITGFAVGCLLLLIF